MSGAWVREYESMDLSTLITNLDGVAWHKAPRPRRLHRCRAQTSGWIKYTTSVDRCACGAININNEGWTGRNSRRTP